MNQNTKDNDCIARNGEHDIDCLCMKNGVGDPECDSIPKCRLCGEDVFP